MIINLKYLTSARAEMVYRFDLHQQLNWSKRNEFKL